MHHKGDGHVHVWHARLGGETDLLPLPGLEVFICLRRSQVLAGEPPFAGIVEAAVISVFRDKRPPRPDHPEVTDRVWNVIERCWTRDPLNRMTAAGVVDILEAEL